MSTKKFNIKNKRIQTIEYTTINKKKQKMHSYYKFHVEDVISVYGDHIIFYSRL